MSRRNGGARAGRRGSTGGSAQPLVRFSAGTFTRSSEASYYTQPIGGGAGSTFIAWAGSNLLRYDAIDNQPLALFEGSQSNLCPYSEDLNQAAWVKTGASISGTTGAAPDGASDLCTVSFTASASDMLMQQVTGTADATTYMSTVFVRKTTGTGAVRFRLVDRANATTISSDIAISTTWQRIEFRNSWGTGATTPEIGLINGTAGAAQDVEVWGFDVKASPAANAYPTSYVRTTATSATRAVDSLTYTSLPAAMATGKWRFALRPIGANTEATGAVYFGLSSTVNSYVSSGTNSIAAVANGAVAFTRSPIAWSRNSAMTVTVDCAAFTMTIAGATSGNGTGAVGTNPAYGTTYLRVGGSFNGAGGFAFARIGEPYAAT